MGADIVWLVVGSIAVVGTGRAVNGNAAWVARVARHGRSEAHATSSKWVAINVGEVIVDLAISPGELELRDLAISGRGELDGDAVACLTVLLRVAALHLLHAGVLALTDRSVVDGVATVVDDMGRTKSHSSGGEGEQHGCAGELGQRHCVVVGFVWSTDLVVILKE